MKWSESTLIVGILLVTLTLSSVCGRAEEWQTLNESDYLVTNIKYTRHGARHYCSMLGADLADIFSQEENDFIKTIMDDIFGLSSAWIGLSNLSSNGFRWSDGSLPDFKAWDDGQPEQDDIGKPCVYIKTGKWSSERCAERLSAVCMRPAGLVSPPPRTDLPTTAPPGSCPAGYTDTGRKCYRLFQPEPSGRLSWSEALRACRHQPGYQPDLASFHSYTDNAFVTAQILNKSIPYWIGMKKDGYNSPFWSDNSDTNFKNFGDSSGSEDCSVMLAAAPKVVGTWEWRDCRQDLNYICQTHKDGDSSVSPTTPSNECQRGYVPYSNSCYRHVTDLSTWSDAAAICNEDGAHLVSVHSEQENAALLLLTAGSDSWLGLQKTGSGEYEWSNGWYVLYTRWSRNEPSNGGGCVVMYAENGTWADMACEDRKTFICERSRALPITTPKHLEGKCPPEGDWVPFGSYCYKFVLPAQYNWHDAHEGCRKENLAARLVSIHSVVENAWLYEEVQTRSKSNLLGVPDVWIGLHRSRRDKRFIWEDGSSVQFTNWALQQPQDPDCVKITKYSGTAWEAHKCDKKNSGYICKVEKIPRPTTPTEGPGQCPSEAWTSFGSSCFLFQPDNIMSWRSAMVECRREGGHLASVREQHEEDFIYESMLARTHLPKYRPFWLGAKRNKTRSEVFNWVDGMTMLYTYWGKTYPRDEGDCLSVDHDTGVWKNQDCSQLDGFVCRTEKVTVTPTSDKLNPSDFGGMPAGAIAAIVICVLMVVILSIVVVLLIVKRRNTGTPQIRFKNSLDTPATSTENVY